MRDNDSLRKHKQSGNRLGLSESIKVLSVFLSDRIVSDRCKRFSILSGICIGERQYLTTSDITGILQSYSETCGRQH